MIHVDEARLESDLGYRFQYVSQFMGFGPNDVAAIHAAAPALEPLVSALVDAVYEQLRRYDATWRHFVPAQQGYEGSLAASVAALEPDHEVIRFRKKHLGRYLTKLVSQPYDAKMVEYLDFVGKMHTNRAGSPLVNVPLVQMNALLGFVADALTAAIHSLKLERDREIAAIRAFNKLLWLQNDLINRHYLPERKSAAV